MPLFNNRQHLNTDNLYRDFIAESNLDIEAPIQDIQKIHLKWLSEIDIIDSRTEELKELFITIEKYNLIIEKIRDLVAIKNALTASLEDRAQAIDREISGWEKLRSGTNRTLPDWVNKIRRDYNFDEVIGYLQIQIGLIEELESQIGDFAHVLNTLIQIENNHLLDDVNYFQKLKEVIDKLDVPINAYFTQRAYYKNAFDNLVNTRYNYECNSIYQQFIKFKESDKDGMSAGMILAYIRHYFPTIFDDQQENKQELYNLQWKLYVELMTQSSPARSFDADYFNFLCNFYINLGGDRRLINTIKQRNTASRQYDSDLMALHKETIK